MHVEAYSCVCETEDWLETWLKENFVLKNSER